jgi:hypothetical protein
VGGRGEVGLTVLVFKIAMECEINYFSLSHPWRLLRVKLHHVAFTFFLQPNNLKDEVRGGTRRRGSRAWGELRFYYRGSAIRNHQRAEKVNYFCSRKMMADGGQLHSASFTGPKILHISGHNVIIGTKVSS